MFFSKTPVKCQNYVWLGAVVFLESKVLKKKQSQNSRATNYESLLQKLLNWNLKNEAKWKMMLHFKGVIFRFHFVS